MSPRTRSILAWVLFALGTLIILVGSLTLWVKRQALDTDAWVDTSSKLLEDDEVRMALSVYIVDQLYASADPQEVLEERPHPETVRATETSVALQLTVEEARGLLADNTDLVQGLFRWMLDHPAFGDGRLEYELDFDAT